MRRSIKDIVRATGFKDFSSIEKHNSISDVGGKLHFVRHDEHRHAALGKTTHDEQDLARQLWIH